MEDRWQALPRPVAFVLAGGATLGATQVGMLHALAEQGLQPDLVVGTSVGALNGAVLADVGSVAQAAAVLDAGWRGLSTPAVFPGSRLAQAVRVVRGRSVHPDTGLRRLIHELLGPHPTFERLALPFAAVTTNVLTGHAHAIARGELVTPLLASAALPGILPTQTLDGTPHWDGGVVANVPLRSAQRLGAASLVVLDPGDICHRAIAPQGAAASSLAAMSTAIRQRVLVEVGEVARDSAVLYLPRPCVTGRAPLSFASTPRLLEQGRRVAASFLTACEVPRAGQLVGAPHAHDDLGNVVVHHGDPGGIVHLGPHEPRFSRGLPRPRPRRRGIGHPRGRR